MEISVEKENWRKINIAKARKKLEENRKIKQNFLDGNDKNFIPDTKIVYKSILSTIQTSILKILEKIDKLEKDMIELKLSNQHNETVLQKISEKFESYDIQQKNNIIKDIKEKKDFLALYKNKYT